MATFEYQLTDSATGLPVQLTEEDANSVIRARVLGVDGDRDGTWGMVRMEIIRPEPMRYGRGATRPAVLAINPRNRESSAVRRQKLLDAYAQMDSNFQADLLELAETWAFRATAARNNESREARTMFRRLYVAAGMEEV